MGAYDRLQPGLFIMRQGDRESKWHGHGPAPEYKGETAIHAMTMPPFYIIAQLKYTGTGFTKQTSSLVAHACNFGLDQMAQLSDLAYDRLAWCTTWYLREDTLKRSEERRVGKGWR